MTEQQEKKNKITALLTTTGFYAVFLFSMLFIIAWKAPDPPLGELGVDLNIGLDLEGSGDVQPEEPIGTSQPKTEQVEESQPEKPVEQVDEKPVEKQDDAEEIITSKDEESPAVIKESKKEEVKPKVDPKPVEEKPKEKVEEKPIAVYKPSNNTTKTASTEKSADGGKEGKPGNQGDDIGKTGDKGDPRGTVDGKAMYGTPGNGGGGNGTGSSLQMAGWEWDRKPVVEVSKNESGRVRFEIKVDENGEVISIKTLDRTVSAEAEQICKREIQKLTLSKSGGNAPPISTGIITFVMRSQ